MSEDSILEILCKHCVCLGSEEEKREFEVLRREACGELKKCAEGEGYNGNRNSSNNNRSV